MKNVRTRSAFIKGLKRMIKRGHKRERLDAIIELLRKNESLPVSTWPHLLQGEWSGYWECHVKSDWLLVYKVSDYEVLLANTGTHADLFE